jgi:hypothetical protein
MSPVRRRLLVGAGALLVLAALAAGVAVSLLPVARDLREVERLVDRATLELQEGRLDSARRDLARAQDLVLAANESLRTSPVLGTVGWLPGLAQNVRSLEDSIGVAARLVHGGNRILAVSGPLQSADGTLEVALSDGAIPLGAVTAAQREIATLADQLVLVAPPGRGSRLLAPQVRQARSAVQAQVEERRTQLQVLARGLSLLRELSGGNGPRRYLIAVANTAEMRGAGGMILSFGILDGVDGGFDLREFGRIDRLQLDRPVARERAGLPEDYLRRWEGFDPTLRWRNATLAADFGLTSPLLLAMYEQATGERVDGVIQIDPQGLAAILEGVGPVEVPELGILDAGNVVDVVLYDAYARFPDIDDRSDVLGDVAEAAFERLVEGEYPSLRGLAEALVAAVDGRHILMRTTSNPTNATLAHFGADGSLPDRDSDHLHLTVQNVSANKLDYFVDTALRVTGTRPLGEQGHVRVEIEVVNTAPPGAAEPFYVFGPHLRGEQAGLYRGVVSLHLPAGTAIEGASGGPVRTEPALFSEDGRAVASFTVDLPAGTGSTVVLDLRLPPRRGGPYELVLVPSPRVRPTVAHVDVDLGGGARAHGEVVLDGAWRLRPGSAAVPGRAW